MKMQRIKNITIIGIVIVAAAAVVLLKQVQKGRPVSEPINRPSTADGGNADAAEFEAEDLPRLVDLGAGKCVACKMMEPVLDELHENYSEHFTVDFIDVWENQDAAGKYGIQVIPTQIFYDAKGNELFRHEGFFSKEEILETWNRHGVEVDTDGETN